MDLQRLAARIAEQVREKPHGVLDATQTLLEFQIAARREVETYQLDRRALELLVSVLRLRADTMEWVCSDQSLQLCSSDYEAITYLMTRLRPPEEVRERQADEETKALIRNGGYPESGEYAGEEPIPEAKEVRIYRPGEEPT